MCAIHGLLKTTFNKRNKSDLMRAYEILHRVPVVFNEYHGVCTRECEAQATNMSSKKETVNTWVPVECLDNCMAFIGVDTSI